MTIRLHVASPLSSAPFGRIDGRAVVANRLLVPTLFVPVSVWDTGIRLGWVPLCSVFSLSGTSTWNFGRCASLCSFVLCILPICLVCADLMAWELLVLCGRGQVDCHPLLYDLPQLICHFFLLWMSRVVWPRPVQTFHTPSPDIPAYRHAWMHCCNPSCHCVCLQLPMNGNWVTGWPAISWTFFSFLYTKTIGHCWLAGFESTEAGEELRRSVEAMYTDVMPKIKTFDFLTRMSGFTWSKCSLSIRIMNINKGSQIWTKIPTPSPPPPPSLGAWLLCPTKYNVIAFRIHINSGRWDIEASLGFWTSRMATYYHQGAVWIRLPGEDPALGLLQGNVECYLESPDRQDVQLLVHVPVCSTYNSVWKIWLQS